MIFGVCIVLDVWGLRRYVHLKLMLLLHGSVCLVLARWGLLWALLLHVGVCLLVGCFGFWCGPTFMGCLVCQYDY